MRRTLLTRSALLAVMMAAAPLFGAHAEDTFKIGFVGAFTGALAPYDQPTLQGGLNR